MRKKLQYGILQNPQICKNLEVKRNNHPHQLLINIQYKKEKKKMNKSFDTMWNI